MTLIEELPTYLVVNVLITVPSTNTPPVAAALLLALLASLFGAAVGGRFVFRFCHGWIWPAHKDWRKVDWETTEIALGATGFIVTILIPFCQDCQIAATVSKYPWDSIVLHSGQIAVLTIIGPAIVFLGCVLFNVIQAIVVLLRIVIGQEDDALNLLGFQNPGFGRLVNECVKALQVRILPYWAEPPLAVAPENQQLIEVLPPQHPENQPPPEQPVINLLPAPPEDN